MANRVGVGSWKLEASGLEAGGCMLRRGLGAGHCGLEAEAGGCGVAPRDARS